jgi:hypothetical protein
VHRVQEQEHQRSEGRGTRELHVREHMPACRGFVRALESWHTGTAREILRAPGGGGTLCSSNGWCIDRSLGNQATQRL